MIVKRLRSHDVLSSAFLFHSYRWLKPGEKQGKQGFSFFTSSFHFFLVNIKLSIETHVQQIV